MARLARVYVALAFVLVSLAPSAAQAPVAQQPVLTPEQMQGFLTTAKIVAERPAGKGVTGSIRATLTDGTTTHDVHVQTVDEAKAIFEAGKATELNFRDTYRYNIAGYRLAQLVGIQTVPMSVERRYKGKNAAVTWWLGDVFDEAERQAMKDKMMGPDPERTQKQLHVLRVWDELIQNRDRNTGNLQWTADWTLWLIDHTRAFRMNDRLLKPEQLTRCDRSLFEKMKLLTEESVTKAMKGILTRGELRPILKRRDAIVQHFETLIAQRGEAAVLYSM